MGTAKPVDPFIASYQGQGESDVDRSGLNASDKVDRHQGTRESPQAGAVNGRLIGHGHVSPAGERQMGK